MNKLIKIVSVLVVAGMILTACASTATQTTAPATQPATASTEVEVFSWWVGPGEADGLAAMVKVFECGISECYFRQCRRHWWCWDECQGSFGNPSCCW